MNNQWWLDFYNDEHAELVLTKNCGEVFDFISKCHPLKGGETLFDQCCGKGYLANEFIKRGIKTTGVDASKPYIEFANANYSDAESKFILADAKEFVLKDKADIGINWYTSFGYDESDDENIKMIKTLSESIKPHGSFFIATMNPRFVVKNFQKFIVKYIERGDGTIIAIRESFIENNMLKSKWLVVYPDGERKTFSGQVKMYDLSDFKRMLPEHGLRIEQVYSNIDFGELNDDSGGMIVYGKKA